MGHEDEGFMDKAPEATLEQRKSAVHALHSTITIEQISAPGGLFD